MIAICWALGKKKVNYAIFGVTVGVVMFAIGFFTYPTFSYQNNTESLEEIKFGADVLVEVYNANGELKSKWEGHNILSIATKNALAACITGLDLTPLGFNSCNSWFINMRATGPGLVFQDQVVVNTLLPEGCSPDLLNNICDGWRGEVTFDYAGIPACTAGTDCPFLRQIDGRALGNFLFNSIVLPTLQEIEPNDRVVATMTFSIP